MRVTFKSLIWIALVGSAILGLMAWNRDADPYVSPWPEMGVRGNEDCGQVVTATFGTGTTESDLDALIGPRVETYEIVYGPRVRIRGRAVNAFKRGAQVVPEHGQEVRVALGHDWPKDILEREVVVEGCLSRTYYSWEASHLDPAKLTERQKKTANVIRALPVGFVYGLREVKYDLVPDERPERQAESVEQE